MIIIYFIGFLYSYGHLKTKGTVYILNNDVPALKNQPCFLF